ncbi:hypothetical protein EXIGLDRAFT_773296 [Exidia glandulosa HHB12029]|uniref:Large ribosomal subunit protein bL33m n=1 Tax=Exidia glandulosa HHB12029 TaxID=1314781 RepID=A0A165EW39_EXIGL|nr:hypothetical protein EXIGLDRAFT_773296 [Exidia glandulosa HHB12029]
MARPKAKTLVVRLLSTAQTGFMYTIKRKRMIGYYKFVKYDPIARARVLFVEQRKTRGK